MENYSFITNNCLGSTIYQKLGREYDNPFMGSYFQDDDQYLKFCLNFNHYISLEPIFSNPKLPIDTNNKDVPPDSFPVMFLEDIEIHWIHETDKNICLEKYKRSVNRMKEKIPFFIWGDSLLHRPQTNKQRESLINNFIKIKNSIYFNKYSIEEWKDKSFEDRNVNNGWAQPLKWLDPDFIFTLLYKYFENQVIDVIIPIYKTYKLLEYQFTCWRKIKGEYRILICDNTPINEQQNIVIPEDFRHKTLLFRNESEGIDGERHGSVLDYMIRMAKSDIVCIQDSDFFWLDENIFEYVLRYFKNGYKCVGTDLYYPAFEKVNKRYPDRHSSLAPCVFGMFIDRNLALSETFVVTRNEGYNELKETGWRIRKKIIDENIKNVVFPAIQHPEQKNFNIKNSNVPWFYVGNQKFLGVHLFGGTSYNINHTDLLFEKIYKLFN